MISRDNYLERVKSFKDNKLIEVITGIRNMLMGYSDSDFGHVLETIVYLELIRRGYRVFIGKWYGSAVDFIADDM